MTELKSFRFHALMMCIFAASLCANAVASAQTPGQFDKPASVRSAKAKPDDPIETRCTYFSDMMLRETVDGPSSENAAIVRDPRAACRAQKAPGETVIQTSGMTLNGRKGAFLLFSEMDPHGATGFVIIGAQNGKTLFRDAARANPVLQSLTLENGSLRLRYTRGVNAPCSLMQNAQKCWAELVQKGLVPAEMKAPSSQICNAAYKRDKAPRDNPSIIVYATDVLIDAGGSAKVLSRGAVECDSMP